MTQAQNEYGVLGLGRICGNLARQPLEKGIRVFGFGGHPYGPGGAGVSGRRTGLIGGSLSEYYENIQ